MTEKEPDLPVQCQWKREGDKVISDKGVAVPVFTSIPSSSWVNDMKGWPLVRLQDIFQYVILSPDVDGQAKENFKALASIEYLHACKVGAISHFSLSQGLVYITGEVSESFFISFYRVVVG